MKTTIPHAVHSTIPPKKPILSEAITLSNGSNYLYINIPENNDVLWQEINICVDGYPKKMKIIGPGPYTPPLNP